jgi:hypothetical protein
MKKLLLILLCVPLIGLGQIHQFKSSRNVVTIADGKSVKKEGNIPYWFWISEYTVCKSKLVKCMKVYLII